MFMNSSNIIDLGDYTFSSLNKIGKGQFAEVFKGFLLIKEFVKNHRIL